MTASAHPNGAERIAVRLSQVPVELRFKVAEQIVARGKLGAMEALDLMTAAAKPQQDPFLLVDAVRADRVLGGKLPPGDMPKVWLEVGKW